MRLLPLLLLTACAGGAPAGTWSGALSCGDEDSDGVISILLDLGKEDATTFSGPAELSFEGTFEMSGAWREYREDIVYDEATLSLDSPSGAQLVHLVGAASSCDTTIDGEPYTDQCSAGDDLDMPLSWDGADEMLVDQGDCAGSLSRG